MPLDFNPPLLNSANPWATSREDLQALYECPYTGAMTTRTSVPGGFAHDDTIHQYCFFDDNEHKTKQHSVRGATHGSTSPSIGSTSSLNTLGYSPHSTRFYLETIFDVLVFHNSQNIRKPVIFSVTGSPQDIVDQYRSIADMDFNLKTRILRAPGIFMEINLSCPNIAGKPPPAYSKAALLEYLAALGKEIPDGPDSVRIGIKTPPYTHQTQFEEVIDALLESCRDYTCPISFITATNTLGNCLVLESDASRTALNSSNGLGIGGLAGSALHSLALGNVATLRRMLDMHEQLVHIEIIGVGGVSDAAGYKRMRSVGAAAVAVGTALGSEGVGVFEKIWREAERGERRDMSELEGGEQVQCL